MGANGHTPPQGVPLPQPPPGPRYGRIPTHDISERHTLLGLAWTDVAKGVIAAGAGALIAVASLTWSYGERLRSLESGVGIVSRDVAGLVVAIDRLADAVDKLHPRTPGAAASPPQ